MPQDQASPRGQVGSSGPALRVLLIDDNVEFANLLGTLLGEQGLEPVLAHTAKDGLTFLDRSLPVAVVLDLLLPDMTGHKVLKELASRPSYPPLFVMSGIFKGAAQEEKVRKIAPIQGWFEKPFDTSRLVQAIVQLAGRQLRDRRSHRKVGTITGDFDIEILDPVDDRETAKPSVSEEISIEFDVIESGVDVVESDIEVIDSDLDVVESEEWIDMDNTPSSVMSEEPTLSEPVTSRPSRPTATPARPTSGFGQGYTASAAEMAAGLRTNLRRGDLSDTTIPRLINAFYVAQETGEIVFERGPVRKLVYFEQGLPIYAISNQDTDRIGSVARRMAGLSDEQLNKALEITKLTNRMTGDVLVDLGYLDPTRRDDLVTEQIQAIIRSLFTWAQGRYVVGFKTNTQVAPATVKLDPAALVVTGVRDLFELTRLRSLLPDTLRPMPSPNPSFALHELPLTDAEAMVVLGSTGSRTVIELLGSTQERVEERVARGVLYSLLTLGVFVTANPYARA